MRNAADNIPRALVANACRPSSPASPQGNAIDPGPFLNLGRNGDAVILMFERVSLVLPRCGAIGLAYWLSELVE